MLGGLGDASFLSRPKRPRPACVSGRFRNQTALGFSIGPYGEYLQGTGYSPIIGYTGHHGIEPTGLIYMRGRFYAPAWHSFMNSDQGVDPNSINQVAYVCGNPLMGTDPTGYLNDHQLAKQENAHYRSDQAAKEASMSSAQKGAMNKNERLEHVQDEIEHPNREHLHGAENYTHKDIDAIVKNTAANMVMHRAMKIGVKLSAINHPARKARASYEGNYEYSCMDALAAKEIFGEKVASYFGAKTNVNSSFVRPYGDLSIPEAQALVTARGHFVEWDQSPSTDSLGLLGWGDNGWRLSTPDDMLNFVDAAKVPSWP